jgi:hypothetical protein
MTWSDVFYLASLDNDPIDRESPVNIKEKKRVASLWRVFAVALVSVSVGFLFSIFFDYILFPHVPNLVLYRMVNNPIPLGDLAQASQNLTAYLALVAAVAGIFFTYRQLRAKVRADSRQEWINTARRLLADIVSDLLPENHNNRTVRRLNSNRIKLELMLNPSEKDHRLLSLLIRALCIPGELIEEDRYVADKLAALKSDKDNPLVLSDGNDLLYKIIRDKTLAGLPENRNCSISYIIRLSHLVLKREWERVKFIR